MPETLGPASSFVLAAAPTAGTSGVEIATPPGEAHGSSFPPFDAQTFPSQLIWLAIAFGALYWLMSRIALPRIADILEDRHDRIADDLEEAARLKAESEAAAVAYEKALAGARSKAGAIATQTRDTLTAEADAGRKALEAALNEKLTAAEHQIAATKTAAMANVRGIAVDAAGAIVQQIAGLEPGQPAIEAAVDAAISN
ncbi:MAG TPA: F0F1 ATP synthase subunit B [Xanthobacteraceae bacterium]|nr:F0F1 ATP synthase subunit B [Xanthobacteraceae bacterium]